VRWVAPTGVAVEVRPTDFCTPEQSNSSTPASPFPSVAILGPREEPFGAPRGNRTHAEPCGSCSFTRNVYFSRSRFARPETCGAGTGQLGPPDANEAGENRGSQRAPHFDDRTSDTRGRFLPPCATVTAVSDTPVASSVLVGVGPLWTSSTLWLGSRQDRFRGGLVKGVRFPDPRCLPSLKVPHNPPAPKCGRTHGVSVEDAALT